LGESRNASSAREPPKRRVSRPFAPSIVSSPSPAAQAKRSSRAVVAAVAVDDVVAVAGEQPLGAAPAHQRVGSAAALDRHAPDEAADTHEVVAASGAHADPVEPLADDAEVGGTVVADVDVEPAAADAQGELAARAVALDDERALLDGHRVRRVGVDGDQYEPGGHQTGSQQHAGGGRH
jgi:hypothetical protein